MDALKLNCGYIEPDQIPLGKRLDNVLDKKTCSYAPVQVKENFQYVSVVKVLTFILSNKDIRKAIESEEPSKTGLIESYLDSENFKNHPFLQKFKDVIRLKLYYDELEVVNPLGSKTGIHKLGEFYHQIDNLPTQINSTVRSIHVLAICSSYEDIKKYGFNKILAPFMAELEDLETDQGVLVKIEDEVVTLRATIIALCGDGLAIHQIYNLLGPSAFHFCRNCLYSRDDLHSGFLENGEERTKE